MMERRFSFAELNRTADLTKLQGMPKLPLVVRSSKYGKELHGPCPFCKTGTDRFMVDVDRVPMTFYCRQCHVRGNAMDYIALREGLSMERDVIQVAEILSREIGLGAYAKDRPDHTCFEREKDIPVKPVPPNSSQWRKDLLHVVQRACNHIFEPEGKTGLDYLYGRGFCDETIRNYHIGYIPRDLQWHEFRLKRGITIPTFVADELYRVRIRCISDLQKAKYIQVSKSDGCCLFNASDALFYPDILFTEGEFDAMIVNQELERSGNRRIRAVTFGSSLSRPKVETYYRYFRVPTRIIISYDNDATGKSGSDSLLATINTIKQRPYPAIVKTLPPGVKDWNDFYLNGENISEILEAWFPIDLK